MNQFSGKSENVFPKKVHSIISNSSQYKRNKEICDQLIQAPRNPCRYNYCFLGSMISSQRSIVRYKQPARFWYFQQTDSNFFQRCEWGGDRESPTFVNLGFQFSSAANATLQRNNTSRDNSRLYAVRFPRTFSRVMKLTLTFILLAGQAWCQTLSNDTLGALDDVFSKPVTPKCTGLCLPGFQTVPTSSTESSIGYLDKCGEGKTLGKRLCVNYEFCDGRTDTIVQNGLTAGFGVINIRYSF